MTTLELAAGSDLIRAHVLGRAFPDRTDASDGNWLQTRLELQLGAYHGVLEPLWRAESFGRFRTQLKLLYETLTGEARFEPDWEGSLNLLLTGDGMGHISVTGESSADAALGPWLRFELRDIDQTYLPALIDSLLALETEYPTYP